MPRGESKAWPGTEEPRKRLVVTAVGGPLSARAQSAIAHFERSSCNDGLLLMDGGGWSWRLEDVQHSGVAAMEESFHISDGHGDCVCGASGQIADLTCVNCLECLRIVITEKQETINGLRLDLEQEREDGRRQPFIHRCGWACRLRSPKCSNSELLDEIDCPECLRRMVKDAAGAKGAKREVVHSLHFPCGTSGTSTWASKDVTCPECLHKWADTFHEKLEATRKEKIADARGAKRDTFISCLAMFEKAVLEEDAACRIAGLTKDLMRGEKMHRRYRKAEVMLLNLRAQLVKMACGSDE